MSAFDVLPTALQAALSRLHISTPTPVQQAALPPALKGRDVLATSQTGTGKTFAFLLPLLVRMRQTPDTTALILSPTRELAQQTQDALHSLLSTPEEMPSALIIGGDNIHKQYAALRRKPRIIIGTPGRVIDHIGRKSMTLKNIAFLVLDEADRMLDMGFIPDVRKIFSAVPGVRQTFLFSATLPKEIEELSDGFLQNPVRVQIGSVTRPVDLVLQQFVRLTTREKLPQLVHELQTRKGLVLVFVKSRHGAERLAKQLKLYGCKVAALHGDLRQSRRRQVMEQFRLGDVPALVATDVAARGIDVDGISCVINYDLPQCPEDYIHRIGRTGRAGSVGTALSFVTEDKDKWGAICRVCHLGKLTELTKTSQVLPAPKFVPSAPVKKKASAACAATQRLPAVLEKEELNRAEVKEETGDKTGSNMPALSAYDPAQVTAGSAVVMPSPRAIVGRQRGEHQPPASVPERHSVCGSAARLQKGALPTGGNRRCVSGQAKGSVSTFRKAARAAAVLAQEEKESSFWTQGGFAVVRVGSKKKAHALARAAQYGSQGRPPRRADTEKGRPAAKAHLDKKHGGRAGRFARRKAAKRKGR